MKNLVIAAFLFAVSLSAYAQGYIDQGGSVYGFTTLSSPGFTNMSGMTSWNGYGSTASGASQTSGTLFMNGSVSVPSGIPSGFATAYGSAYGGSSAFQDAGFVNSNNWLSTSATANATNGGSASMSVNGSTSGYSFSFPR
jgi:hypothetical protein